MKAHDLGQLLWVGALFMIVEAANRRSDSESSWPWPSHYPSYRSEFTQDSDYNRVSNTGLIDDYDYDADNRLTDEAIIDLLYSRSTRSSVPINFDHPTLSDRTTYTSLYYPDMQNRQQPQFPYIQREASSNFPIISSYSHTIVH